MLDVPESLLDERRRLGLDVFDEVWEGVLHMVPSPSGEHQRLGSELIAVFVGAAKRRGFVASYETGLSPRTTTIGCPTSSSLGRSTAAIVASTGPPDWSSSSARRATSRTRSCRGTRRGVSPRRSWSTRPTRRFELYRNDRGTAVVVAPGDDGGVTLDTLGVRLLSVDSADGLRLRVTTDTDSTDC